jgi:hypothetical protein
MNTTNEDYQPFGDDWKADMMKLTKQQLIELLKNTWSQCQHPWHSVVGDGETQPARCLKCNKIL